MDSTKHELSDCKAELDQWRASAAEFKGLCEEWQALAEAAEQKFEAASEAYENLQFDAGAERQRANAAEARVKQLRAALERIADHPDTENGTFRASIARDALASKEGGE